METESVLQVGDKIRISTWLGSYIVKITRVTKTKAIADVVRKDGSRYTCEFKRKSGIISSASPPLSMPCGSWDTCVVPAPFGTSPGG